MQEGVDAHAQRPDVAAKVVKVGKLAAGFLCTRTSILY